MIKTKWAVLVACMLLVTSFSEAKTIRATEMNSALWSSLSKGTLSDIVVEFRQGDELPVNLVAEGDLLETTRLATSYIGIKRNFWVRLNQSRIQISLDGTTFKEINETLTGSLEAEAGSDHNGGLASAINVAFRAFLK